MTDTYWVRLKPDHHYFFGGENGLGSGDTRNYLVRSRLWPQQTSLLGMVRYLLLREKGWLADGKRTTPPEANKLIGERSFSLGDMSSDLDELMDFGGIQQISPIFLQRQKPKSKEWHRYHVAPFNAEDPLQESSDEIWYGGAEHPFTEAGLLKSYQAKVGFAPQLVCATDGEFLAGNLRASGKEESTSQTVAMNTSPFIAAPQVGIEKGRDGRTKDQAFYKQTFIRLAPNWSFGFYLTVSTGTVVPERTSIPFGGERSLFHWEANSLSDKIPDLESETLVQGPNQSRIVLLSDSLVEAEVLDDCQFAVIQEKSFRFLQSENGRTKQHGALSNGPDTMQKSNRFNLLCAGSVLYPKDTEKVTQRLKKARLRQIGYNHFLQL